MIITILSKNDDIENESNTGDYVKPTKAAKSNKTSKRNNSEARKTSTNPDPPPKKNLTTCKEIWQCHHHFGKFNGQGLKGMGTLK